MTLTERVTALLERRLRTEWSTRDVWVALRMPHDERTAASARAIAAALRAHGFEVRVHVRRGNRQVWVYRKAREAEAEVIVAPDIDEGVSIMRGLRRMIRRSKTAQRTFGLALSVELARADRWLESQGVQRTEPAEDTSRPMEST